MRRSSAHLVVRLLATAVLMTSLVVPASPAFAALEDEPKIESDTNPSWPNGEEIWWRDGWGNSAFPRLKMTLIPNDVTESALKIDTLGMYYWVTRGSAPDTSTAQALNVSIDNLGSMHEQTFDLEGLYADEGLDLQGPGSIEGTWTFWITFYNRFRTSSVIWGCPLGYDITPPSGIANLVATASTGGAAADAWTETTRRYVRWTPAVDALAGIGVYKYELNGKFLGYSPGVLPGQWMSDPLITLESLPAGKNKITVTPIDRATNAGPPSTVYAYVDPDVPVIKLTSPTTSGVSAKPTIKATATDAAGIRNVKFYVNDKLVYTDSAAPYACTPSLSAYANGSWLTIKAVAEDMFGHKATASKSCKLDKVAPSIKNVSDSPDPFYPVLQDRYKDNSKVTFTLGEKATVFLRVYTKKGKLIREIKTSRKKGKQSIKWNGKNSAGEVKTGTFYFKLVAKDGVGNVSSTKKFATHIKNYQIVRISSSAVRVIPR